MLVATAAWMADRMKPQRRNHGGLWLGPAGRDHLRADAADDAAGRGHARSAADVGRVHRAGPRRAWPALLSVALPAGHARAAARARADWRPLAITAAGVVFGFPLFTSIAMRHVEAVHASVIVGVLPLATAAVGAWLHRQRPSLGFWVCAALGSALVVGFRGAALGRQRLSVQPADVLLLAAMACAAVGYGYGARLSQRMRAEHVICWALVISLPLTLPAALLTLAASTARRVAPGGASPMSRVFSMWLGFFAWYRGLALGGTVRVSQVQLVQPFLGMLFAVPLLGEKLDAVTLGFAWP